MHVLKILIEIFLKIVNLSQVILGILRSVSIPKVH